jgi:peptidyl-prolyl cis-trans isomerase A (cyclophilin A)
MNVNNLNEAPSSLVTEPISDIVVEVNSDNTIINLFEHFDDPLTTGQIARFELSDPSIGNGIVNVLLFDQEGQGASLTVQNFLNYVNDGDYTNTIIHRSVPGFVIQGGGFIVDQLQIAEVPADPPVQNEFSQNRSNLPGTIALAKLADDPNSATNQWFFNLADNSENLDNQNGGFTVFGQVLSASDFNTIEAIANIPVFNGSSINPAFTELPLNIDPANPIIEEDDNFIRFRNITVSQVDELNFSVVSNSRPDLVDVTINNGQLELDYLPNALGTAEIVIRGTNLLGETEDTSFQATILEAIPDPTDSLDDRVYRFFNTVAGGHFFTTSETERDFVLNNLPQYVFEGIGFNASIVDGPDLVPIYRFFNTVAGGHFFTASETERNFVLNNLPQFIDEGIGFYAFGADANLGADVFRFFNTVAGGHFFTTSQAERDLVLNNLPQYVFEGVGFEADFA